MGALIEIDQEPFVKKDLRKNVFLLENLVRTVEFYKRITKKEKIYTINKVKSILEKKVIVSSEKQAEIISNRKSLFYFFAGVLMTDSGYMYFGRNIKTLTVEVKAKDYTYPLFGTEK